MKPVVFVITPFDEDFIALFESLKERFEESYEFTHAGDLDNQQNILKDIIVGIHSSDIIIADLTGLNPNVFYELGLAHAMNKKVVIITQNIDELPFDIKSYRANQYSMLFSKIPLLYEKLEKLLVGALDNRIKFGSPYSDFIHDIQISINENIVSTNTDLLAQDVEEEIDENAGFLDNIASIDESMSIMTTEILEIQNDMSQMTDEINNATNEISRVKTTGGDSLAVFMRNTARKLSLPVASFSEKLKKHISIISTNWYTVENSYLALLDDDRLYVSVNVDDINKNIESLKETQIAINDSDSKIEGFITVLKGSVGLERRLTKAITILINELQEYLAMTSMMASSIDRILSKSHTVFERNQLLII